MRVRVDASGVVTSAANDLLDPFMVFPINLMPEALIGMRVITDVSGVHLLLNGNQVVAREDVPPPTGGSGGGKGEKGDKGDKGDQGTAADMARVEALERAVTALQAQRLDGTTGQATIATNLIGGGTRDVVVPFVRALPDTGYAAVAIVDGPTSLGGNLVPAYPITGKQLDRCTVTVKNNALISLGATAIVTVVAIRSGA